VLLIIGAVFGFIHVSRDTISCGSGFGGLSAKAQSADIDNGYSQALNNETDYPTSSGSVEADCKSAVSDRKTLSLALVVPGAVLVVAAFVVASYRNTGSATAEPVNVPSGGGSDELDRLAALHASGALSDEEFTAAKAKLLGL